MHSFQGENKRDKNRIVALGCLCRRCVCRRNAPPVGQVESLVQSDLDDWLISKNVDPAVSRKLTDEQSADSQQQQQEPQQQHCIALLNQSISL
jgi:hypothetical protein